MYRICIRYLPTVYAIISKICLRHIFGQKESNIIFWVKSFLIENNHFNMNFLFKEIIFDFLTTILTNWWTPRPYDTQTIYGQINNTYILYGIHNVMRGLYDYNNIINYSALMGTWHCSDFPFLHKPCLNKMLFLNIFVFEYSTLSDSPHRCAQKFKSGAEKHFTSPLHYIARSLTNSSQIHMIHKWSNPLNYIEIVVILTLFLFYLYFTYIQKYKKIIFNFFAEYIL